MKPRLGDSTEDGALALGVDAISGSSSVTLGARARAQVLAVEPVRVVSPPPAVVPVVFDTGGGGDGGDGGAAGGDGDGGVE